MKYGYWFRLEQVGGENGPHVCAVVCRNRQVAVGEVGFLRQQDLAHTAPVPAPREARRSHPAQQSSGLATGKGGEMTLLYAPIDNVEKVTVIILLIKLCIQR